MKMNVRMKVMASVGSVVVLLAILGVMAVFNLGSIRTEFEGLLLATNVERDAFNTILAEKNYVLSQEEQYYEEAKSKVDAINSYLDEIDRTSSNEMLLANARESRRGTKEYAELYHKGVAALKENAERALVLQEAGEHVTDQAQVYVMSKRAEAGNSTIMQQINTCTEIWKLALQIRMNEKEYMLYRKPENFETMKTDFALMMKQLDRLEELSTTSEDLERIKIARESARIYEQEAYKWVDDRKTLDEEILVQMKDLGTGVLTVAQKASSDASENMVSTQEASNKILIIGMIAGLVIGMGIAFYMGGKLSKPIKQVAEVTKVIDREFVDLAAAVEAIANNDLTTELKESHIELLQIKSNDEIGDLAKAFNGTIESKIKLSESFTKMVENLTMMVSQLTNSANEVASAAAEISTSAEQISRGAKNQEQQVTQVTTAVEEMTATIVESSKNAGEASEGSKNSAETATAGGQVVNEAIEGMNRIVTVVRESSENINKLASSADQIGEIIGVIDDVADQTNLLALNAAIEAARAGEQGRGFAVVADEVRKLAERTGKATGEITDMIKGIQQGTQDAVASMETGTKEANTGRELTDKAGNSLSEIVNGSQRVMDMIQQIATATEEQSAAAEQISRNVEQVSAATKESASGAEQAATAAEELSRNAEGLQQIVARFKVTEATS